MIKIKYVINGALFRREWARDDLASALARIDALRASGIDVTVRGLKGRGRG